MNPFKSCVITVSISCDSVRECVSRLLKRLRPYRRRFIIVTLVVAFFYVLGYFSTPVSTPGMCLIYG